MRKLQADDEVTVRTEDFAVRLPAFPEHAFQIGSGLFVDQQLARIGPAFFDNGRRLSPDKLCAASPKTAVAAESKLVRPPIQRAVTTFHRLNAQRVACAKRPDRDGTKECAQIAAEADRQIEPPALVLKLLQGMEFEITGQAFG